MKAVFFKKKIKKKHVKLPLTESESITLIQYQKSDISKHYNISQIIINIFLYSYFEGPTPVIVSSDLDFLHEVFVKQFKNFHARKVRIIKCY
jgi:hypothetical protein